MKRFWIALLSLTTAVLLLTGMGPDIAGPNATITDINGTTVTVEGLTYDYAPFVTGKLGSGDVRVELNKVDTLIVHDGHLVVNTYGTTIEMGLAKGNFSGKTGFGSYTIPASQVKEIKVKTSR
ncbi:hypothetical protein [Chrysiogenes arsenatis]|uniref:hypothetical protein n=1 Tax=Chrysiogenes arsenatis TaxID=309797 RepID=UPI00041CC065|nr:hypothetical protein [Chrysiogenes arsenatis]